MDWHTMLDNLAFLNIRNGNRWLDDRRWQLIDALFRLGDNSWLSMHNSTSCTVLITLPSSESLPLSITVITIRMAIVRVNEMDWI
jgi:hypothetical protein